MMDLRGGAPAAGPAMAFRRACVAFALLTPGAYVVAQLPPGSRAAPYLALHLALTLAMLAAWRAPHGDARWVLAAGLGARLALAFVPPFTSSDVRRYLWDGAVVLRGLDPWQLAPDADALAALRAALPTPTVMNVPTLYPPLAVGLFTGCAALGPTAAPWAWRVLVLAASCATPALFAAAVRGTSAERHLPLVALSPLLTLEAGVGLHLDALVALSIAGALLARARGRPALAGVLLGVGTGLKLLPVVVLASLALRSPRAERWRLLAGAGPAVLAAYLVPLAAGRIPLGSVWTFFARWRFGAPLHQGASAVLPGGLDLLLIAGALVAVAAVVLWRARSQPAARTARDAVGGLLLVSPVVFPWYFCSLVPLLGLHPSAFLLAWSHASPLTYEVIDRFDTSGQWVPAGWPLWAIAAAGAVALLAQRLGGRRSAPEAAR